MMAGFNLAIAAWQERVTTVVYIYTKAGASQFVDLL